MTRRRRHTSDQIIRKLFGQTGLWPSGATQSASRAEHSVTHFLPPLFALMGATP
jgi:hypothetical protein